MSDINPNPSGNESINPKSPEESKNTKQKEKKPREKRNYRLAVRVNEIVTIEAESKIDALKKLKKYSLGDLINQDGISFLGR